MFGEGLVASVLFAAVAGAATFFAPCSYALLPGYVGYYVASTGGERAPLAGAALRGSAASAGAIGVFGVLSVVAVLAGGVLQWALPALEVGVGLALVVLGLWVAYGGTGAIHVALPRRRSSVLGFAIFGGMYAAAATGCVLPLFLAIALGATTASTAATLAIIGAYAGVFAALMLAVTVATAVGHGVGLGRLGRHTDRLVRLAGVVLVLAGLGQLWVALAVTPASPLLTGL